VVDALTSLKRLRRIGMWFRMLAVNQASLESIATVACINVAKKQWSAN
jgi:hypothetical protein